MKSLYQSPAMVSLALFSCGAMAGAAPAKKDKALVVVSFGTTFPEGRANDIEGLENALAKAFPDRDFRRAFTSKIVMRRLLEQQHIKVHDLSAALDELQTAGYRDVLIQPTHMIHGEEYEQKVLKTAVRFKNAFAKIAVGKPLLADDRDYDPVAAALITALPPLEKNEAAVFMGHGSPRDNNPSFGDTYQKLQSAFDRLGYPAVVGVVEEADRPNFADMRAALEAGGYTAALLTPLMVVAGDHVHHDLAGAQEDSWKSRLTRDGVKTRVRLGGVGRNAAVQALYVEHARFAAR